jgi:3-oxoacyl-[acyl-carrier protein] reductase
MDLNIKGKNALITGGSRGLGKQAALSLASEGVNIAICGRTVETIEKTVKEISDIGVTSYGVVADVSDISVLPGMVSEISNNFGDIDILINNAGGTKSRADILGTETVDFKSTFDLNVFSGFELMRLLIPHMQCQKWGRVLNVASIWGREYGGNISYMSSKAALIALTKHAAVSLASTGILINSIAPGSIEHEGGSWERFRNENTIEIVESFIQQNLPMGKFGWPEPFGALVSFLCSDLAGMITGSSIVIDGGQSISMV